MTRPAIIARARDRDADTLPTFNPILRSKPVSLGKAGYRDDIGQLSIIYDAARCMALPEEQEALLGDIFTAIKAAGDEVDRLLREYNSTWGPLLARQAAASLAVPERISQLVRLLTAEHTSPEDRLAQATIYLLAEQAVPVAKPTEDEVVALEAATNALSEAVEAQTAQIGHLRRARLQRVIGRVVLDIGVLTTSRMKDGKVIETLTWPWKGTERPDPARPETFAILDQNSGDWVQAWITTEGIKEVVEEMRSPLFGRRSSPITI